MTIQELKQTLYRSSDDSSVHRTSDHRQDMTHYHVPLMRLHQAALHGWGIATGLQVTLTPEATAVTIAEGVAIDGQGRLLPLASQGHTGGPGQAFIHDTAHLVPVPVVLATAGLADGAYHVTLELASTLGPEGHVEGQWLQSERRIVSTPLLKFQAPATVPADGSVLILATVEVGGGTVTSLSGAARQYTQLPVGAVVVRRGGQRGTDPAEVGDLESGRIEPLAAGGLQVVVPQASDMVVLEREGAGNFQELTVRAERLHVHGDLAVEGTLQGTLAPGLVGAAQLVANAVTNAKLADNAVNAAKIVDGSVGTAELTDAAVTNAKLADDAVSAAKIVDGSVGTAELTDAAVTNAKLADDAVSAAKIVDGSVGTAELTDAAVTNAKLADNAVNATKIVDGSVGTNELANSAVTAAQLQSHATDNTKRAVGTAHLQDGAVTTEKVGTLSKLDVAGRIKGGGVLAGIWNAQPLADVVISTANTWQDVPETSITFTLDRDAVVFFTYSINVQPNGNPGRDWLGTQLVIDGVSAPQSGSHFQPLATGDANMNLHGSAVLNLTARTHTVSLRWLKFGATVASWSNSPTGSGQGGISGRTLIVMAFYQ